MVIQLKKFMSNKQGLAYTWAIGACSVIGGGLLWWVLMYSMDAVTANIFGSYSFTGATLAAYQLAYTIATGLPFIICIIVLIWGMVHAKGQAFEQ
jgi:thiamine transporter ThiT